MSPEPLRATALRREREGDWRRLESLLGRLERGSVKRLDDADLLALPVLYRSALSSLSVARATVLDASLVGYLESLSSRAYFVVYGANASLGDRVGRFFALDWPAAARRLGRETLAAAVLVALGAAVGLLLTRADADWFYAFVPGGLAQGRDPTASTQALRGVLFGGAKDASLPLFATFLFTHNGQVAVLAFALGFAFCVPTAFLLVYTGATLGAFFALYAGRGLGLELGGWLFVHGVTELWAVILAGAGGFHIGTALAQPGRLGRLAAAVAAGRRAATLLLGALVMLVCAGLLEGVVRQTVLDTRLAPMAQPRAPDAARWMTAPCRISDGTIVNGSRIKAWKGASRMTPCGPSVATVMRP